MKKTAIVTGANTGMGKETARELARLGMKVIMACRNREKGEAARKEIVAETGNQDVQVMLLDLASRDSIRGFVREYEQRNERLDVLVNNAGVSLRERTETDGVETTIATNHIGPFLLTILLVDLLKRSRPARVVVVASMVHRNARFDPEDFDGKRARTGYGAYANSKLLNILFSFELARRLAGTGVTVTCLNPGLVNSEFFRNYKRIPFMLRLVKRLIGKTPAEGARTAVWLASAADAEGVTGKYFENRAEAIASPVARDEALGRKVWDLSERLAGLTTHA
jgi:NAD(P)-dependent dehydrogenase (short-subunit alcohol dehydrogenase family)